MISKQYIAALILTVVAFGAEAERLFIHAGTLLAVPGETPLTDQTIVVSGNRIESVSAGFTPPADGDTLLDLSDQFVLPGLMDMHVHLLIELDQQRTQRALRDSGTMSAMRGVERPMPALVMNMFRFVLIPWALIYIFVELLGYGLTSIWVTSTVAFFPTAVLGYWAARRILPSRPVDSQA